MAWNAVGNLLSGIAAAVGLATDTVAGLVEYANGTEALDSEVTDKVMSPALVDSAIGARVSAAGLTGDAQWLTGGPLPTSVLPDLAITSVNVVASQAAMLALTAQQGDVAVRTDNSRTYILSSNSPSTLADWKEITAPGAVLSVNGSTGTVVLVAADVGAPPTSRTVSAGGGLTGGGDLSANRTLAADFGTTSGKVAEGSRVPPVVLQLTLAGAQVVGTGACRALIPAGTFTIEDVTVTLGTAGSSTSTYDVNLNGTTIYSTQSQRPSLTSGQNAGSDGTPSTSSVTGNGSNYLTVDTDAAGTGAADAVVTITLRRTS